MKKTKRRALYVFAALLGALFVLSCLAGFAACGGSEAEVESVSVTPETLSLYEGNIGSVTASVTMSDGSDYDGTYTWSSDATSVATVSGSGASATVTGVKEGSAKVTVTAGGQSATCTVSVVAPSVTGVALSESSLALDTVGNPSATLTASVTMDSGSYAGSYEWKSDAEGVATVSGDGDTATVTAVAGGTAKITVTASGKSAECTVTVTDSVAGVSLSDSELHFVLKTADQGGNPVVQDTATLTASVNLGSGSAKSDAEVTWSVADAASTPNPESIAQDSSSSIITIAETSDTNAITVTPVATGSATITATYTDGDKEYTAECAVHVYDSTATFEAENAMLFNSPNSSMSSTTAIGTEQTTLTGGTTITNVKNFNTIGDKIVFEVVASAAIEDVTIDVTACNGATFGGTFADNDKILTVNGGDAIHLAGTLTNSAFNWTSYGILTGTISLAAGVNYIEITAASTSTTGYLNVDKITLDWTGSETVTMVDGANGSCEDIASGENLILDATEAYLINAQGTVTSSLMSVADGVISNITAGDEVVYQINAAAAVSATLYVNLPDTETSYPSVSLNGAALTTSSTDGSYAVSLSKGVNYVELKAPTTTNTTGMSVSGITIEQGHELVGTYTVDSTTETGSWTYTCGVCGETIDLTSDTNTVASVTLQASDEASLAAAVALGGNVELTQNITLTGPLTIGGEDGEDVEVTLDLAGHTLSTCTNWTATASNGVYSDVMISVGNGASLTIEDTSSDGSGKIEYTYSNEGTTAWGASYSWNSAADHGAVIMVDGGTLVIESGTIETTSVGIRAKNGEVTINGGVIYSTGYYVIWEDTGTVTVTINDGFVGGATHGILVDGDSRFKGSYSEGAVTTLIVNGGVVYSGGTANSAIRTESQGSTDSAIIKINGGLVYCADVDVNSGGDANYEAGIFIGNGTLEISGGTIVGPTAVEIQGGKLTITGGTIISNATGEQNIQSVSSSDPFSYGYALAIYPRTKISSGITGWTAAIDVTISGGTFYGDVYVAGKAYDAEDNDTTWSLGGTNYKVSISGATVYGDIVTSEGGTLTGVIGDGVMTNSTRVTGSADTDHTYVLGEDDTEFGGSSVSATYDATTGTYTLSGTAGILTAEQDMAFDGDSTHIGKAYFCFTVNVLDGEYATFEAFSDTAESTSAGTWVLDNTNGAVSITGFDDADETNGAFILGVKSDGETSEWHMNVTVYDASGTAVASFTIVFTIPTSFENDSTVGGGN